MLPTADFRARERRQPLEIDAGSSRGIAILKSNASDASASSTVHAGDELTGRVALITGGSRGIGLACAVELARAGAQVVITRRNLDSLRAAHDAIGENCTLCAGDALKQHDIVSDSSSWITGETLVVDGGSLVQWGRIRGAPATKTSRAAQ
jgi:hypothetical protein